MEQFFQVGIYSNTHGVRGEIKVFPTTDDPRRFKKLKQVILRADRTEMTLQIESVRYQKQFVLLKFKGIDNINDIERYKGAGLWVPRKDAVPLGKNEFFIADLIGMTILDEAGNQLGTLTEVLQTGANDVYVCTNSEREILLPNIDDCIKTVDVEQGVMTVHLMEGLLDL